MHPAYSVIVFTTASGAGYGILFWVSLMALVGGLSADSWPPLVALTLGLVLVSAGLLSSTLHLGHPERAHRAFSQWRSSWLSREGVAAVATFGPAGLLWLCLAFGLQGPWVLLFAFLTALGAAVTVYCTGMIYASLRTVRQWYRADVPVLYLALAGVTGLLLLMGILSLSVGVSAELSVLFLALMGFAVWLKWQYWRETDHDPGLYTVDEALGFPGKSIRPLDPPHTQPNFVMREMGYSVGRKHAPRLRRIAWLGLFLYPACLALAAAFAGNWAPLFLLPAVPSMVVGILVERWLFFAEAEHVSMLYYGRERA